VTLVGARSWRIASGRGGVGNRPQQGEAAPLAIDAVQRKIDFEVWARIELRVRWFVAPRTNRRFSLSANANIAAGLWS
jgi:hypothetical protein